LWRGWVWLAGGVVFLPLASMQADIVEKKVVVGERVVSIPVFDARRSKTKLESVIGLRVPAPPVIEVVPLQESRMVHPALETEENHPRPRFGYGSDYPADGDTGRAAPDEISREPPAAYPTVVPPLAPVIQFQHSYRPRDYWIALPYARYYGNDCRSYPLPWGISTYRSRTSVSIRTPGVSLWFSR